MNPVHTAEMAALPITAPSDSNGSPESLAHTQIEMQMQSQNQTAAGHQVIFGTGPAACWTAQALRQRGVRVVAVNRSGQRPALMPADVKVLPANVLDRDQAVRAAAGASVVYQALGPAYSEWEQYFPTLQAHAVAAAQAAGARYVSLENLYMLDPSFTMTETSPIGPRSRKGELRLKMHEDLMALNRAGDLRVAVLRASDYYGPGVRTAMWGERVWAPLVAGKAAQLMGDPTLAHSQAFITDVGQALAHVGCTQDSSRWGRVWLAPHAPAPTSTHMLQLAGELLGAPARQSVLPAWGLRLVGLFNADARASVEMLYQVQMPFVVDSSLSERTMGLQPTALREGLRQTLAWYAGLQAEPRPVKSPAT